MSTFFINGKPPIINEQQILPFDYSLLIVHFNKIPIFSGDLINFIISFISLFVSVITKPLGADISFLSSFILSLTKYYVACLANIGAPIFNATII